VYIKLFNNVQKCFTGTGYTHDSCIGTVLCTALYNAAKPLPLIVVAHKFNVERQFLSQSARTKPQPLQAAANSIVCTDDATQLLKLFHQEHSSVSRPVRVPSRRCSVSQARCELCLNQTRCQTQGTGADM